MTWKIIGLIALSAIVSAGGIGGIIIGVIKFSANQITEHLTAKYQLQLDKELEKYSVFLENKTYISKTKFDTEFSIYRELSKAFFNMTVYISDMIPYSLSKEPADKDERKKLDEEKYKNAHESTVAAQNVLFENAPFIPKDIFNKYNSIRTMANVQLSTFSLRWNVLYFANTKEKEKISFEARQRTKEMREKLETLNEEIREYLSKLDVID